MKYSQRANKYFQYSESGRFYKSFIVLLVFMFGFSFTSCQQAYDDGLPAGDLDNGGLLLPDGFEAVVVVDSIGPARELAVNYNGDIYVKLRRSFEDGSIVALRDTTGDGRADIIEKFDEYHEEGNFHTGMKISNGYLYFSTNLNVFRYPLIPGELIPDLAQRDTIMIDDHSHGIHEHHSKGLALDNQGNIYVPFGAQSDNCAEDNRSPHSPGMDPCPFFDKHGGIWKYDANQFHQVQQESKNITDDVNPTGTLYATGLRSMTAIGWNPGDEELYIVQHGRDYLFRFWPEHYTRWDEAVLPAEEFIRVTEGGEFSWPYCYYDQLQEKLVLSPEYGGDGVIVGRCDEFTPPIMGFPGHFAPNHLEFYHGEQFPDHYTNGAFVAMHGSYHRNPYPQAGYFVAFVPYINGEYSKDWEVFANGFAGVDIITSTGDAEHRPTGLAIGPDGSMYISDGVSGKIWRVMYKGDKNNFGSEQLARMEEEKRTASNIRDPHIEDDNLERNMALGGETLYRTYCQACHQGDGQGITAVFPPLAGTDWVTGDKDRLISIIIEGLQGPIVVRGEEYNNPMPSLGYLSDEEIAVVTTYIRQNFGNNASEINVDEVRAVRNRIEQD